MDELSVGVEGIGIKVKKLVIRNMQLKEKLLQLEGERAGLQDRIRVQELQIKEMEDHIAALQAASVLNTDDSILARQKVNDLLREIDKCQVLLNR